MRQLIQNVNVFDSRSVISEDRLERYRRGYYRFSQSYTSIVGLVMVVTVLLVATFAPVLAPHPEDVRSTDFATGAQSPSLDHPLGTDTSGRDILTRILFGARISLMVGATVLTIAISLGTTLGLIAGYLGGWTNTIIMRVVDVFLAIPPIVLAMAVIAATEQTLFNATVAISFSWWAWYARLVNGEVLSVKEEDFVEASKAIGSPWYRSAFREVLPNVMSPIIVKATLDMGFAILVVAALSFLGLGAQPPTPDWGTMAARGRDYIQIYWWISTIPGIAIAFTVLGFNLLGDGLRDVFDVDVQR